MRAPCVLLPSTRLQPQPRSLPPNPQSHTPNTTPTPPSLARGLSFTKWSTAGTRCWGSRGVCGTRSRGICAPGTLRRAPCVSPACPAPGWTPICTVSTLVRLCSLPLCHHPPNFTRPAQSVEQHAVVRNGVVVEPANPFPHVTRDSRWRRALPPITTPGRPTLHASEGVEVGGGGWGTGAPSWAFWGCHHTRC
jgi:hypothetical protein